MVNVMPSDFPELPLAVRIILWLFPGIIGMLVAVVGWFIARAMRAVEAGMEKMTQRMDRLADESASTRAEIALMKGYQAGFDAARDRYDRHA